MFRTFVSGLLIVVTGFALITANLDNYKPHELYRDQVAVLMYHHLHSVDESSSTITPQLFEEQLLYLQEKGYHFLTLNQFKQYLDGDSVPDNAILVTFDDGYESFYTDAFPILEKLGVPAVNFAITQDTLDPLSGYIPYMSEDQIQQMTAAAPDRIEVQCHTHALHNKLDGNALLTTRLPLAEGMETESEYHQRIVEDTATCRSILEGVNSSPIDSLAYPFGIYNNDAVIAVQEGGIRYAFTIAPGMATRSTDRYAIPRINAGGPSITPDYLHNTILRRTVALKHDKDRLKK